jgi:hypothetical protein
MTSLSRREDDCLPRYDPLKFLGRRIARTHEVAELVCVVPGKTESWLIEQAVTSYEAAIDGCLTIGMVRDAEGALAFRHELARSSGSPRRQRAERGSGTALCTGGGEAGVVCRRAPRGCVAFLGRPSAWSCPRAEERAQLLEQLSYECYLTDQIEPAIEARRSALQIWNALGSSLKEGDALRWLSRLSWFAGRRADADRYAVDAVQALDSLPPGPELAMA